MSPPFEILGCLVLFWGLVFGLGLPLVVRTRLAPEEKICAAAGAGLIALYLWGLLRYGLRLPPAASIVLPALALAFVARRWRNCLELLRHPRVGRMLGSYLLVTAWLLGLLALVRSYSGGGWALDWAAHYDRARFFLERWPPDRLLLGRELLPTRPPLANVVTATFLSLTGSGCPYFQIFTTLAGSLTFLPGWLFAGRFGGAAGRARPLFAVLFLLNPAVLENGTFAWTKLPTAFFVLTAWWFLLPGLAAGSRARLAAAFGWLAAGVITHYSAAPFAVAFVGAYAWCRRREWTRCVFWTDTLVIALPATALLATWFGWALPTYGARATFFSNTAVVESTAHSVASFIHEKGYNLFATVVPHLFRPVDPGLIAQTSRLGFVRDYCFMLYQVNLVLMFGSVGGVLLIWLLATSWRGWAAPEAGSFAGLWVWLVGCSAVLGVVVCGGIDEWGLAHVCLIPLLVLGLAFLAGRAPQMPRLLQAMLAAGLAVDFVLGVVLQFYLENLDHLDATAMQGGGARLLHEYGVATWVNFEAKRVYHCAFVGDWPIARPLLLALLACLLVLALTQLGRAPQSADPAARSG